MSAIHGIKSAALDASGRLLVYAAPIIAGFRGAPLALSAAKRVQVSKSAGRRNWAKRRAFES